MSFNCTYTYSIILVALKIKKSFFTPSLSAPHKPTHLFSICVWFSQRLGTHEMQHESNLVKLGNCLEHKRSVLWEGSLEKRPSGAVAEVFVAPGPARCEPRPGPLTHFRGQTSQTCGGESSRGGEESCPRRSVSSNCQIETLYWCRK